MRKIRIILLALLSVFVGAVFTSCDEKGGEQSPHLEFGIETFKAAINGRIEKEQPYIIVDFRSKEAYDKGHIPGSVWLMQGTVSNMDDNSFAKAILKECGNNTNYYVFLVGNNSSGLKMTMGGSVSGIGFGKNHTIVLIPGYSAWQEKNQEDPERFPIVATED